MSYIINQESVNKIHEHFRKRILKDHDPTIENEYISKEQIKKIKAEISRLKIILRECQPEKQEFYQEMIGILKAKIKTK